MHDVFILYTKSALNTQAQTQKSIDLFFDIQQILHQLYNFKHSS